MESVRRVAGRRSRSRRRSPGPDPVHTPALCASFTLSGQVRHAHPMTTDATGSKKAMSPSFGRGVMTQLWPPVTGSRSRPRSVPEDRFTVAPHRSSAYITSLRSSEKFQSPSRCRWRRQWGLVDRRNTRDVLRSRAQEGGRSPTGMGRWGDASVPW